MKKLLSNEEIAEAVFEYLENRGFQPKSFHIQYQKISRLHDMTFVGVAEIETKKEK